MKILYITTSLMQQDAYGGYDTFWSDNLYAHLQETAVEHIIDKFGRDSLLISVHGGYRMPPWTERYRKHLVKKKQFDKVLKQADLVLSDWPTTVVFKALRLQKPLFLMCWSLLGLDKDMKNYVERQPMYFMRDYAVCKNDGKSAKRAVDKVLEIGDTR